jgi:hypothetical protein
MRLLLVRVALAAFPAPPSYPECGEPDRPELCPPDLDGHWAYLSYIPADWEGNVRDTELLYPTGMSIDRAWRTTTGRPDVVVAVLDSGIRWREGDLRAKIALNSAELPLPENSDIYDADGNGVFNVDDYALDSRVSIDMGVDEADHHLDGSDLIAAFSNGIDDDGNGYVDDIAGWDFFFGDNDPFDDIDFGHGTGEAKDIAAEAEDGDTDIGVCPNCMVLFVRAGDGFVVDSSTFRAAVAYAVDRGAPLINNALGSVSDSDAVAEAMRDAWEQDTLIIASAADETAWHPNSPSWHPHGFYVHAIQYDGDEPEDSESFVAFGNCTNHGARLDGSASSTDCSSGATSMTAGVAGLVVSAARDAGIDLSAAELHAILSGTASDIAQPDAPEYYPTAEGWDGYTGWGRVNAEGAVLAAAAGAIPPTAMIDAPSWYAWIDPEVTPVVPVTADIDARAGVASWTLESGAGLEPSSWTTVSTGSGPSHGEIASWSPTAPGGTIQDHPEGADTVAREATVNTHTVTLRLTVTDTAGRSTTARRVVYVHHDPDLLPGFPLHLPGSMEASPVLVDLDGDSVVEIVQADGAGFVHVLRGDGTDLPGFPARVGLVPELDPANPANHRGAASYARISPDYGQPIVGTPAAADLDGDGTIEIVAATMRGSLYVFQSDGSTRPGFPVFQEEVTDTGLRDEQAVGFLSSPALGDLDGDGALEIVIGGFDGKVYAWTAEGVPLPGWPVRPRFPGYETEDWRITSAPGIADLDGDGGFDVVIGTNEELDGEHVAVYAFHGDGTLLDGWPERVFALESYVLPMVGQGYVSAPAFGDFDGDGDTDVVLQAMTGDLLIADGRGDDQLLLPTARSRYGPASNASDATLLPVINSPSAADVDGDGHPDVVTAGVGVGYSLGMEQEATRTFYDHLVGAWSGKTGDFVDGFPRQIEDLPFFNNPIVADIDGDRRVEVIVGTGGFLLHAWDRDGEQPEGWPKLTGQWIIASPAVGDIDGDGDLDVVVGTRQGSLFAWGTQGPAGALAEWPMYGHDPMHTRDHGTPLDGYNAGYGPQPKIGIPPECGCGARSAPGALGVFGAGVALAARRRRYRSFEDNAT